MPFDSPDFYLFGQGAFSSDIAHVPFTAPSAPVADGEISVCRIGPTS